MGAWQLGKGIRQTKVASNKSLGQDSICGQMEEGFWTIPKIGFHLLGIGYVPSNVLGVFKSII